MNFDDIDKEVIADLLANMLDWDSQDIQTEFIDCMKDNFPKINLDLAEYLFTQYLQIDPIVRMRPGFNHTVWVELKIESFKTDRLH